MDFLKLKRPKTGKTYFKKSEFESHGFPVKPTPLESFMLANLVYNILNPIRVAVGLPIYINDCYRTMAKYYDLIKRKYNPSPTSDHFWGQSIPTIRQKDKNKYGKTYSFSSGAVDFGCRNTGSLVHVFNTIRELVDKKVIDVGQCILESKWITEKGKKVIVSQWIHISNPREIIYNKEFMEELQIKPRKFLYSSDNGKTYKLVA